MTTARQYSPNFCACGCGEHPRNYKAKFISGHRRRMSQPVQRFWAKVEKTETCWLWTAAIGSHGYGTFWTGEAFILAHRYSLQLAGRLVDDLHVDHLCRVRRCVNPDHLEPVTQAENNLRMQAEVRERATHCRRGHEWTEENTYRNTNGYRECRTCIKAKNDAAYAKRKAQR